MTFETYRDREGGWRWRLKAGNGRIVAASSEAFHDQQATLANARLTASSLTACLAEHDAVPQNVEDESTTEPMNVTE